MKKVMLNVEVPAKLVIDLNGKFKPELAHLNENHERTRDEIIAFTLELMKGYRNYKDGKHPRVTICAYTLSYTLGEDYKIKINLLEKLGIIEVRKADEPHIFTKYYWLTSDYLDSEIQLYELYY